MSTTLQKLPHARALDVAERFRALFRGCYEQWQFAGSLRRQRPECADIDHVVIPAYADVPGAGLFAEPVRTNLLLHRADQLRTERVIAVHVYPNDRCRWGDKLRGVDWGGIAHEIHAVGPDAFGACMAISTGPAEFSRRLVTGLLRNQRRNHLGQVWACDPCIDCGGRRVESCKRCDGTGLVPRCPIAARTEEEYFELTGVRWVEPKDRV